MTIGRDSGLGDLCHSYGFACQEAEGTRNASWPWFSTLHRWFSPTVTFPGKYACICLTISCYGSIPVPYGDWEG